MGRLECIPLCKIGPGSRVVRSELSTTAVDAVGVALVAIPALKGDHDELNHELCMSRLKSARDLEPPAGARRPEPAIETVGLKRAGDTTDQVRICLYAPNC